MSPPTHPPATHEGTTDARTTYAPVADASVTPVIAEIGPCQGCGGCLLTCPEHAIRPVAGGRLLVRADRCTGCGQCQEVCPVDAIEMRARS